MFKSFKGVGTKKRLGTEKYFLGLGFEPVLFANCQSPLIARCNAIRSHPATSKLLYTYYNLSMLACL